MATRPKEVYGKKLIYRYSAPVIFTLLFSLIVIGAYVLSIFFPYIHGESIDLTGYHFIMYPINLFTDKDNLEIDFYSVSITDTLFPDLGWLPPVIKIWMFVMSFDFYLMGLFAFILAIGCIVMLLSGRLKHWKLPYNCTGWIFIPGIFYYGTAIGLNVYAMIQGLPQFDILYTYIIFGTIFVLLIVIHIIYSKAFKNHVYVKNLRTLNMYIEEYEKENMVIDTSNPEEEVIIEEAPKIVLTPADDQTHKNDSSDNRKKLPKGIKHIGGHAFSQNTVLEEADIPLGIEVLGAGAFANCVNLKVVHIPESVKKIEYNCFFNCIRLERITYGGSREMWKRIKRGSNWLTAAGTKFVVCRDGALAVDTEK